MSAIRSDTAHVRSLRLLDGMGEVLAAVTLVCAGALFIGLATVALQAPNLSSQQAINLSKFGVYKMRYPFG